MLAKMNCCRKNITKELICIPTIPQSNNQERKISYAERENFTHTIKNQISALLATIGTGSLGDEEDPPRCGGRGAKESTQCLLSLSDSIGFQDRGWFGYRPTYLINFFIIIKYYNFILSKLWILKNLAKIYLCIYNYFFKVKLSLNNTCLILHD